MAAPATLFLCLAAWMVLGRAAAATSPQADVFQRKVPLVIPPFLLQGKAAYGSPNVGPSGISKQPSSTLRGFPPACPSASNIENLCTKGHERLVYGPQTSFNHLTRQEEALNHLEAQVAICCRLGKKERLPCCRSAWEKGLLQFCKREFAIKTQPYLCCREASDEDRLTCFANLAQGQP